MRRIIGLIVMTLILMIVVGCDNTSNDVMIDEQTIIESNNSYDSILYNLESINGEICSIKMIDNNIYVQSYEEKENATYYSFYRCDEKKAIPIISLDKDTYISAVTVINEKIFYLLRDNISNELIEKLYVFDNNKVLSIDIGDIINSDEFDVIKLEKSEDKLLILADNVYMFDQNLEYVKTINYESNDKLIDTAISGNDKIICAFSNRDSYRNECTIYEFDVINSKWSELIELDCNYTNIVINGYSNNFLYKANDGIYSFDLETNETNKVLDYSDSYMSVNEIEILESKNENEYISLYESDGKLNVIAYELSDSDDDRKTILLGCYHCDYNIKNEIIEYNKTNLHYKIIIKDYAEYDNPVLEINKDFSSEAAPDILIFNNKNKILNIDTFIQKEYLEDVSGYFENTFEPNEYIVNALDAMKTKDKMYFVSPYFEINAIAVQNELYSQIPDWSIKTIIEYVEKNNIKLTGSTGDYFSLLTGDESMSPFYDYEEKKAYFDDESFEKLMSFDPQIEYVDFSDISEEDYINQLVEDEESFKNGEILMNSVDMTFENYSYTKQRFGEDVRFVSYPSEDGIKLTFPIMIGVSKNSNNKDESWDFIKRIMSKDYQYKCMDHYIPVRRDVFDMLVKEKTTNEPYIDVYGKSVEPMNESYESFGRQFTIAPLSEEQIDEFISLIDDVKGRRIYDLNILEIVDEEIFCDDKQEKKIKSIQNRVTVYLNEQE